MAKENKKNDGQNRCRRCDRPLSDPNANYGWWCAQIIGLDRYKQSVSSLDENAMEMYNRYKVDYLYKDSQTPANNVAIVNYNYQEPTNQGLDCILNTGYENKLLPNSSYELYKQNKTYWMNETGISRGVEL